MFTPDGKQRIQCVHKTVKYYIFWHNLTVVSRMWKNNCRVSAGYNINVLPSNLSLT